MAVDYINKLRIGRELCEWVFLGIRTGARREAEEYNRLKSTDLDGAIDHLKRGVDLPNRVRTRVNNFTANYPADGQAFLAECVNIYSNGGVTLGEINGQLNTLETYCKGLRDGKVAETITWDDIATDIISRVENESMKWVFPLPSGYIDIWS